MELVLGQLADANELILHADRWAVHLMTRPQALADRMTRAYDPAGLADRLIRLAQGDAPASGGGRADVGGVSASTPTALGPGYATRVMDLLVNSVEPDIWSVHGGNAGRVSYFDGQLVIHAPRFVHQRLGRTDLRSADEPARTVERLSRADQQHDAPGFAPQPAPRRVMLRFETDADPVIRPTRYYPPNRDPESIAGIDASQLTP
jgi:hypothetical protein